MAMMTEGREQTVSWVQCVVSMLSWMDLIDVPQ